MSKEQALSIANQCIHLLQERFHAQRVIVFGSLASHGVWHADSDIDLAVEGLALHDFFAAYSACRTLLPPGMEVDLVPLEHVYPEMRVRILGEEAMPENPLLALQVQVDDELTTLQRITDDMDDARVEYSQTSSRIVLRAIASILHEFYTGVEHIFERIAVQLYQTMPRGNTWHTDLLLQMATEQQGVRPPVIDESLRVRLKAYLDFRHFFRHAYGYTLEWERLHVLVEALPATLTDVRSQVTTFFERFSFA